MQDISQRRDELKQKVKDLLAAARHKGATAAEVHASVSHGLSVNVRMREPETIEFNQDGGLSLTVYFGQRKGSANTTDLSAKAMDETAQAACDFARYTSEDECSGLADPGLMATNLPDLDLYHPWELEVEGAIELATRAEATALEMDPRIENSDGASLNTHNGLQVYGNTHGFIGSYASSRHSLSCSLIGRDGDSMQRDYAYTLSRLGPKLDQPEAIGREAAERTLARLGARRITTRQSPVIFQADVAVGLLRSLIGAIKGASIYRKASFLLDAVGDRIFPEFVHIHEQPLLPRELGSCAYDADGVATREQDFVTDGVLQRYVLDSYAARKLKLNTTGNAGGVHNLRIDTGELDLNGMLKSMDTGLLVTELMGQGVNTVTGDYSRGAAGFWVENGEIQYPVEEITIAGKLQEMFMGLQTVGNDVERRSSIQTGSWLIDHMMIAGE